jgi:hypothetical protein
MFLRILLLGLLLSLSYQMGALPYVTHTIDYATFAELSIEELEARTGRTFSWREKLASRMLKRQVRRQLRQNKAAATRRLSFPVQQEVPPARSGAAVATFSAALGALISLLFLQAFPAVLLALLAVILGIGTLVRMHKQPGRYTGQGFAIAGIVVGGLILLLFVGVMIAFAG